MNKITGFVAGSFDVIHPGYIKMLKEAKGSCDYLIVALHKDPTLERINKIKPIISCEERIEIMKSIIFVDSVIVYETENELCSLLRRIEPDIRFLGDDYINIDYTGKGIAKHVIFLDRSHGWSTTKYKKLIYENYKEWSLNNDN